MYMHTDYKQNITLQIIFFNDTGLRWGGEGIYDILPPFTAIIGYARNLEKGYRNVKIGA